MSNKSLFCFGICVVFSRLSSGICVVFSRLSVSLSSQNQNCCNGWELYMRNVMPCTTMAVLTATTALVTNRHVVSQCCKQVRCGCVLPGACLYSLPKQSDCVPGRAEEWEGSACGGW